MDQDKAIRIYRKQWRSLTRRILRFALKYSDANSAFQEDLRLARLFGNVIALRRLEQDRKAKGLFWKVSWLNDFSVEAKCLFAAVYLAADDLIGDPPSSTKQFLKIAADRRLPALAREYQVSLREEG